MVLSYFTREELVTQLKMQFSYDEQQTVDFNQFKLSETNTGLVCELNGRKFLIHKVLGAVIREL